MGQPTTSTIQHCAFNDDFLELGYKAGTETLVSLSIDDNASKLHLEAVVLDAVDETLVCPELSGKPLKPHDWIEEGEQWEPPFERGKYRPPPWIPRWLGWPWGSFNHPRAAQAHHQIPFERIISKVALLQKENTEFRELLRVRKDYKKRQRIAIKEKFVYNK